MIDDRLIYSRKNNSQLIAGVINCVPFSGSDMRRLSFTVRNAVFYLLLFARSFLDDSSVHQFPRIEQLHCLNDVQSVLFRNVV